MNLALQILHSLQTNTIIMTNLIEIFQLIGFFAFSMFALSGLIIIAFTYHEGKASLQRYNGILKFYLEVSEDVTAFDLKQYRAIYNEYISKELNKIPAIDLSTFDVDKHQLEVFKLLDTYDIQASAKVFILANLPSIDEMFEQNLPLYLENYLHKETVEKLYRVIEKERKIQE